MTNEQNTEEKILDAAKAVFIRKGFDGARMQEIADYAGINKAMLHYYFRNKDKLFYKVFENSISVMVPCLIGKIELSDSFEEKVFLFVDAYITVLQDNPYIPSFILHELSRNPDNINEMITSKIKNNFLAIWQSLEKSAEAEFLQKIDWRQFIINIVSLCVFPFVTKPLISSILEINESDYQKIINDRRQIIPKMVLASLNLK